MNEYYIAMINLVLLAILLVVGGYAYYYHTNSEKIEAKIHIAFIGTLVFLVGLYWYLDRQQKQQSNKNKKQRKPISRQEASAVESDGESDLDSQPNPVGGYSVNVQNPPFMMEPRAPQSHISSPDMPYPMREGDVNIPSDATPYGRVRLINYHASWCPVAKSFLPFWNEFANQVRIEYPFVGVFDVLCDGPEKQKCEAEKIDGVPTIILYIANKKIEYQGTRNIVAMMAWLRNNLETAGIY